MDTATTTEVLRCSFCGKPAPEVNKLIAGPGVYICDGCVDTCNGILSADPAPDEPGIPDWDSMTEEQILAVLAQVAATGAQVEASLRKRVLHLRGRGVTWARIGAALGIARQSAWERFSGEQ